MGQYFCGRLITPLEQCRLKKGKAMKRAELSLTQFSFEEKLNLMEALWADLTRDETKLKSPAWHETVLKDREEAFAAGKVSVSDWEQAKKRIKKKVS
jgi:hypothetical protein